MKKEEKKCSGCGRFADCYKSVCSYCSRLNYGYSQGAITLETYNKYMDAWRTKSQLNKKIPDLSSFIGTEGYHKLTMGNLKFTDGMAFLSENLGCFWLADIVGSVQYLPKIKEQKSFILWRIVVKNSEAVVKALTDSGEDEVTLYTQKIKYTDFPEGTFEFYQCGDVVLLKGEY